MTNRNSAGEPDEPVETDRRLAQIMRTLSVALPAVVLAAALSNVIFSGFAKNILAAETLCVVVSALLARYFYRRSRNEEAVFVTSRIVPSGTAFEADLTDYVAIGFSAVLAVMSGFPSVLGDFR
jgi:hypothetical protein